MSLSLHNLRRAYGSVKKRKRVGRGNASGHGTYSGRGQKGQRARSGGKKGLARKGLRQLMHNVPKMKGQRPRYPKPAIVNIERLEKEFKDGDVVDAKILLAKNIIKTNKNGLKILGNGELSKKLIVMADAFSESAKDAIVKAGGQAKAR